MTDDLHAQLTNTVPCTRCGRVEVIAPDSVEDDPLCPQCIRDLMNEAADKVMMGLHDKELAAGHLALAHELDPMDWHHNHDPGMMGV
jgi:hypothetical protein